MTLPEYIIDALAPVIALILAGYCFRKFGFLSRAFWRGAESLTYFILFPALILYRLIGADFSSIEITPILSASILFFIALTLVTWVCGKFLMRLTHQQWTSMLQGSIRYNTFIALALTDKLFGPQMFAVSALVTGVFIISVNLVSVIAFSTKGKPSIGAVALNLIRNPLILACLIGIGLNTVTTNVPEFANNTLSAFGRGALPIALLAVGAGLKLKSLTTINLPLAYSSLIKLALAPLLMAVLATLFVS